MLFFYRSWCRSAHHTHEWRPWQPPPTIVRLVRSTCSWATPARQYYHKHNQLINGIHRKQLQTTYVVSCESLLDVSIACLSLVLRDLRAETLGDVVCRLFLVKIGAGSPSLLVSLLSVRSSLSVAKSG